MNYADYVNSVGATFQIPVTNAALAAPFSVAAYNTELPRSIDYVEGRIQREVDILQGYITDSTGTLTANSRNFILPTDTGVYVIVEQVALKVGGIRQPPLTPIAEEMLASIYPSDVAIGTPSYPIYWSPNNATSIYVGPAPDANYSVEVRGTQRVTQLSSTNVSNILTNYIPDLYIAAGNIFWSAFQRDEIVSAGNEAQGLMGYEQVYQGLMKSAAVEIFRQRFRGPGASDRLPNPIAPPQS